MEQKAVYVPKQKFIYADFARTSDLRINREFPIDNLESLLDTVEVNELGSIELDTLFEHLHSQIAPGNTVKILPYPKLGLGFNLFPGKEPGTFCVYYESLGEFNARKLPEPTPTIFPKVSGKENAVHYIRQTGGKNLTLEEFRKRFYSKYPALAPLPEENKENIDIPEVEIDIPPPSLSKSGPSSGPNEPQQTHSPNFLEKHKAWAGVNAFLFIASVVILATLFSLPLGGLPVLAGLSVLAVAGIAIAATFLAWNLGCLATNLIRKDSGEPSPQIKEDIDIPKGSLESSSTIQNVRKKQKNISTENSPHGGEFFPPGPPPVDNRSERVKLNDQIRAECINKLTELSKDDHSQSLTVFQGLLRNNAKIYDEGIFIPHSSLTESSKERFVDDVFLDITVQKLADGVVVDFDKNHTYRGEPGIFFSNETLNKLHGILEQKPNVPSVK